MIKCPMCGNSESKVIDSRGMDDGIRRRRQCDACGGRFTTTEHIQARTLYIVKKDGRREQYNRQKLAGGILKACEKRPLPIGTIDKLIDSIESELYQMGKSEILSTLIGDKVISRLAMIDHIAYIRFASVYRDFSDIATLKQAVDYIVENKLKVTPIEQLFLLMPEASNHERSNHRKRRE